MMLGRPPGINTSTLLQAAMPEPGNEYFDVGTGSWLAGPSSQLENLVFAHAVLRSRILARLQDKGEVDSHVNAYFIHLLAGYARPQRMVAQAALVCKGDSDLVMAIEAHEEALRRKDRKFRARIYRVNADERLVMGALFFRRIASDSIALQLRRAKTYYRHAFINQSILEPWEGRAGYLSPVLGRIEEQFSEYVEMFRSLAAEFSSLSRTNQQ